MLRQQSILEIRKGERVYQFSLPSDAPLGEVHDILFQMRSFIVSKLNEAIELDRPKEKENPPQ